MMMRMMRMWIVDDNNCANLSVKDIPNLDITLEEKGS